jgi:hypothetical protein
MSSRFSLAAGSAATVTVPAGCAVRRVRAHNTSGGGTLVITPSGGSALPTITIPAAASWLELDFDTSLEELVDGATLVFASTDAYLVTFEDIGGV